MAKVHVVFKTHLDLGFTDFAVDVLENYNQNYIPRAVEMAFELNQDSDKPMFIWTTGSYLIWQYLKTQPEEQVNRLIEAIENGYISWHGLPVTFHAEAAGELIFDQSMKITKELDQQFGTNTISSKMTDVPGHTKGIVPLLANNGIKFLHIGMNGVSAIPDVPENFIWEHEGSKVIVSYSYDYGTDIQIEGCDDVLVFAHTHDNSGPQSKEKIMAEYQKIKAKYPGYEISASTIDNYVQALLQSELKIPTVTEEIGDTWIHGIASDPAKMRDFNILEQLMKKWLEQEVVSTTDDFYNKFIYSMMLIPEHTWGMDIKRYFSDYKNYAKEDFITAREANAINDEALTFRYGDIGAATKPEMKYTSHEWEDRTYSMYEQSWKEQRNYIKEAIEVLPVNLKQEAIQALTIKSITTSGEQIKPFESVNINGYTVQINQHGALSSLVKDSVEYASSENELFKLQYSVIGNDSYEKLRTNYLRDLDKHFWAVDFFKPGIELQNKIVNTQTFDAYVSKITKHGDSLVVSGYLSSQATEEYGAPREITIEYTFKEKVEINIQLANKDAIRYPEIISLAVNPNVNNSSRYLFEKLGTDINPLDVVSNGSKLVHSLDHRIKYAATDKVFNINAIDSRIVSVGQIDNLDFQKKATNINNGFYFHLLNTTWGTNFTMWYEEDINAKFEIEFN